MLKSLNYYRLALKFLLCVLTVSVAFIYISFIIEYEWPDGYIYLFAIYSALLNVRKRAEVKRIERELQEKGDGEKVEVEEESVDWLYGTYKLKTPEGDTPTEEGNTEVMIILLVLFYLLF